MRSLAAALVLLIVFAALYSEYTGYVVVHDETGRAVEARITNGIREQALSDLPFGYFIAVPKVEGEIEVRCSDGSTVRGGYVTGHWKEYVAVIGNRTCEDLRQQ
jgi:hypothetical protein